MTDPATRFVMVIPVGEPFHIYLAPEKEKKEPYLEVDDSTNSGALVSKLPDKVILTKGKPDPTAATELHDSDKWAEWLKNIDDTGSKPTTLKFSSATSVLNKTFGDATKNIPEPGFEDPRIYLGLKESNLKEIPLTTAWTYTGLSDASLERLNSLRLSALKINFRKADLICRKVVGARKSGRETVPVKQGSAALSITCKCSSASQELDTEGVMEFAEDTISMTLLSKCRYLLPKTRKSLFLLSYTCYSSAGGLGTIQGEVCEASSGITNPTLNPTYATWTDLEPLPVGTPLVPLQIKYLIPRRTIDDIPNIVPGTI
ncbi:hypothetical protein ETB97_007816 [Aspergillus alliaceus]|uniref:Uncharacterized protein n=1 Tax=Petromyces alliaceus TaxID=209559 RepID=A0A8H5ZXF5_PETAA|nr:hypothetical protein ETB97_007816 [Aspergillus burnettii]